MKLHQIASIACCAVLLVSLTACKKEPPAENAMDHMQFVTGDDSVSMVDDLNPTTVFDQYGVVIRATGFFYDGTEGPYVTCTISNKNDHPIHLYGDAFSINGRMVHGSFDSSIGAGNKLETVSIQFSRQELSENEIESVRQIDVLFSAYWDSGQEAFSLASFIVGSEEATSSEVPSRAEALYNSNQLVICPGENTRSGIRLQLTNNASYPIFVTIDAVSETVSSQRIAIRDPGQYILPGAMADFDAEISRESLVDASYSECPRKFFIHGTLSDSLTSQISFTTASYQR